MDIEANNPEFAFLILTQKMLSERKAYGVSIRFNMGLEDFALAQAFDQTFEGKTEIHHGGPIPWRDYLTSAIFPWHYYNEHKQDLKSMLKDERIWGKPGYRGKDVTHNFFGRMCRPRAGLNENFMDYTLRRFKDKNHRTMPHFYFDVNEPEWVWHDLVNNPKLIKSWRTACTCVMNIVFRWDSIQARPIITIIVKHCNWSHSYGDVFGANMLAQAFCKELGFKDAEIIVYCISLTMDESAKAKKLLSIYKEITK